MNKELKEKSTKKGKDGYEDDLTEAEKEYLNYRNSLYKNYDKHMEDMKNARIKKDKEYEENEARIKKDIE